MTGFKIALAFLTRLPVPNATGDIARAAPWLPVVGALVGALAGLALASGAMLGAWIGAIAALLAWVAITGALHIDGLGDVADGLGAAHGKPERFIAVARDPHLGSFGAIAIVLMLLTKLVVLAAIAERGAGFEHLVLALAIVAAWARWGVLAIARAVPPLTDTGLAHRFAAGVTLPSVVLTAVVLAIVTALVAPLLLLALPLVAGLALYWRGRLGGVTGDCYGASIEVLEAALLFLLLLG